MNKNGKEDISEAVDVAVLPALPHYNFYLSLIT